LVKAEIGTDDDDGTPGIIYPFTEEILTKASLLSGKEIGKRAQNLSPSLDSPPPGLGGVNQGIHRLLKHSFFVANDNLWSTQLKKLAKTVVPINHSPIKIIEIGGGKSSPLKLDHRA